MRSEQDQLHLRLHEEVDVLHDDVSRLMGNLGNAKCINAADLYAELRELMNSPRISNCLLSSVLREDASPTAPWFVPNRRPNGGARA
eukprot:SAG31_NODE_12671_length_925_cov_1.553269_3_plen_87_part_00